MHGIVLEIKNGRCVILKKDGTFAEIRNRNYTVGQEIKLSKPASVKYLSAAACFLLICTALFGHHLYFTPASYIYLDINPSIRLDLNCFERVIDVVPLNDDAEELLSNSDISEKNAQDCIHDIVAACQEQNYLNENNSDIEVSVRTDDSKLESAVEKTSAAIGETNLTVSVYQINQAENDNALQRHISARRLRAVQAYTKQFGGTLDSNLQSLYGVSNDEIYQRIQKARQAENQTAQSGTDNTSNTKPSASSQNSNTQTAQQYSSQTNSGASSSQSASGTEKPKKPVKHPSGYSGNTQPSQSTGSGETAQPETPRQESSDSGSGDSNTSEDSKPQYQLPPARLKAIRAYTEQFGGTLEENVKALQGVSTAEIYQMIQEAQSAQSNDTQSQEMEADQTPAEPTEETEAEFEEAS